MNVNKNNIPPSKESGNPLGISHDISSVREQTTRAQNCILGCSKEHPVSVNIHNQDMLIVVDSDAIGDLEVSSAENTLEDSSNPMNSIANQVMSELTRGGNNMHEVTVQISPETRKAVAQSAAKAGLSPEVFTEQAIQFFLEKLTTKPETAMGRFMFEYGIEQMQKHILQKVGSSEPYTSGTEGDIYRIEIKGKEYIIVKKRYHISQKEHVFQKKAYKIASKLSKQDGNIVSVPELFNHFVDGSNEYIVMEYVHGKTLYTLILEQLITKILLPLIEKTEKNSIDQTTSIRLEEFLTRYGPQTKQFALDINSVSTSPFYSRFEQSSRIHFPNDTDAELGTIEFYNLLYDTGLIQENPNQKDGKTGANPFLIKEYKKYFSELSLFQESESKEIRKQLRVFLQTLHENELYHRDLGGNPRNIMFGENGKIYVIDFGKGVEVSGASSSADEIYHDTLHNGTYDDDLSILTMISTLTESSELSETDKRNAQIEILRKNLPVEQIHRASKNLGLQENSVASVCQFPSNMSVQALVSWLDRLLVKNDRTAPGEFIYYPKTLLGEKISGRMKNECIQATNKGGAKLLVSLFTLQKEELQQLEKLLEEKREKNSSNEKKLQYISLFSRFIHEVLNTKK